MKKRTKIIIAAISIYGIGLLVFNFIIPQINKMNYNGLKEEAAYLQEYFYAKINPEINNEVVHKFTNRNSIFRVNVLYEEKNSIAINWVIKDQDWQIDDIKNNMEELYRYYSLGKQFLIERYKESKINYKLYFEINDYQLFRYNVQFESEGKIIPESIKDY